MAEVSARRSWTELGGWLLALTLPPLVWYVLGLHAQPGDIRYFLAILTCTVVLWLFNLVPAFVPPLFSLLAIILFDVASPAVAAAGFSSTGFFMLLSIFAIAVCTSPWRASWRRATSIASAKVMLTPPSA